jgi:hypothetical protein
MIKVVQIHCDGEGQNNRLGPFNNFVFQLTFDLQ